MKKQTVIDTFKTGHEEFKTMLLSLTSDQINSIPVVGIWSVREVIAHLAAWNWEQADEITRIINCQPTWNHPDYDAYDDDTFNRIQVEKRRDVPTEALIEELEASLEKLLKTIEGLSEEEWNHKCPDQYWENGKTISIHSLFPYEAEGTSDEARHAREINEYFGI